MKRIAVVGGGAAGCFCAIEIKRRMPGAEVTVFEAGAKTLAKLAVTGGGKCNFTNSFRDVQSLKDVYPRGEKIMKRALKAFSHEDAMAWFAAEGIPCRIMEDGRVFPESMDAMRIVGTLQRLMHSLGVIVKSGSRVEHIYDLLPGSGAGAPDALVVTVGGYGADRLKTFTQGLELQTETPVPSLFTFNIREKALNLLTGTSVGKAALCIPSTKLRSEGALLITDWGFSGPAALRLSSYAARFIAEKDYRSPLLVNWLALPEDDVRRLLATLAEDNPQKLLSSVHPEAIPSRIWHYLLQRCGMRADMRCSELGTKGMNRLCALLCADEYVIDGRSRFKDEFVTCGGIAAAEVDPSTLESKRYRGLYFAGEILDIDAVTGGFNLQAAWSTAMCVANAISL